MAEHLQEKPEAMIRLALGALFTAVLLARGNPSHPVPLARVAVELADALIAAVKGDG
jgi:hypothetical protein